mmetsp:Transcript_11856/g.21075  ORF Transcript_11856/g.21075 Transcript_11856/m.21075 type:complete len:300 (-) Transcript_11856:57-956(-)|eukprot:CAMPEP_0202006226 /NCGR_PEP_ID=MMETSP0905-20130828/11044_1 /ASSEMBLY_ACC=CAM_ASM_000554 /TAXON_ID=420261 /ORGANISM="Thalassiosira antarctica, Strain CCMP982" /LENGTH=299 /DNA_ID=CAMNT_0048563947 /DNA_START=61 /DNA_END=960 /DNA_ORIENTATION=+
MSAPTPPIRPYTSYNLFFQLEREYILQTLLGFTPTLSSEEIFDPADETNYQGPPLSSRYHNLLLRNDWHIPGKTQRRKRKHRKTHGKIGFHELNERISQAWSVVDDETRSFCAALSDIESKKYKAMETEKKKEKKVTMKRNKDNATMSKLTTNEPKDDDNNLFDSFDWTVSCFPQENFNTIDSPFPEDNGISSELFCRRVSRGSLNEDHRYVSQAINNHRDCFTEVDMEDDEIIDAWNATHIEGDKSTAATQGGGQQKESRISFIDAEYEKFKEIGKQFLTKQKLTSMPQRKTCTARQA